MIYQILFWLGTGFLCSIAILYRDYQRDPVLYLGDAVKVIGAMTLLGYVSVLIIIVAFGIWLWGKIYPYLAPWESFVVIGKKRDAFYRQVQKQTAEVSDVLEKLPETPEQFLAKLTPLIYAFEESYEDNPNQVSVRIEFFGTKKHYVWNGQQFLSTFREVE